MWSERWLEPLLALPARTALLDTDPISTIAAFVAQGTPVHYKSEMLELGSRELVVSCLTLRLDAGQGEGIVVLALASPGHINAITLALEADRLTTTLPLDTLSPVEEIARYLAVCHFADEPYFDFTG